MQLCFGHVLLMATFIGLQIHDCGLILVRTADQIDSSLETDPVAQVNFHNLFGEFDMAKFVGIITDLIRNISEGCLSEFLTQFAESVGCP